jgi:hypothetical protein
MTKRACLSLMLVDGRGWTIGVAPTRGIYHRSPTVCTIGNRVGGCLAGQGPQIGRMFDPELTMLLGAATLLGDSVALEGASAGDAGRVTVSEFTFLALGLVLGLASGMALVEIIRARPPVRREVKLTVAQDAVPRRRPVTLADDAFVAVGPEPARGGPADRRETDIPTASGAPDRRTHVPLPSLPDDPGTDGPGPGLARPGSVPGTGAQPSVGIPIRPDHEPAFQVQPLDPTRRSGPRAAHAPPGDPRTTTPWASVVAAAQAIAPALTRRPGAVALLERDDPLALTAPTDTPTSGPTPESAPTTRCAEERRIADERCELASIARARADEAAAGLRDAQRAYDRHDAAADEAAQRADPRAVRAAKEEAQHAFRSASRAAAEPDSVEAAAREWLHEINRINGQAREAAADALRERAAASAIGATLERLSLAADAARIGADTADAACVVARVAVAECDERAAIDPGAYLLPPVRPEPELDRPDADEVLGIAIEAGATPRIFRLLRGDPGAMTPLVAALAGTNPDQTPHWEELLTRLIDAILDDAIESSALEFPSEDPFWGPFSVSQGRDIVQALSSLGYRFDGRGGWVDDRIPSQRDLSLALSYAGLDPMRVRHWPDEATARTLFSEVRVAADEYLAINAGDLTLGEMVTMLGRRADSLAELWNHWGTIRPLLLQDA